MYTYVFEHGKSTVSSNTYLKHKHLQIRMSHIYWGNISELCYTTATKNTLRMNKLMYYLYPNYAFIIFFTTSHVDFYLHSRLRAYLIWKSVDWSFYLLRGPVQLEIHNISQIVSQFLKWTVPNHLLPGIENHHSPTQWTSVLLIHV